MPSNSGFLAFIIFILIKHRKLRASLLPCFVLLSLGDSKSSCQAKPQDHDIKSNNERDEDLALLEIARYIVLRRLVYGTIELKMTIEPTRIVRERDWSVISLLEIGANGSEIGVLHSAEPFSKTRF
jgi:hypothetical protein